MEIIFQRVLIYLKKSKKYLFYSVMDNESICQIRNKKTPIKLISVGQAHLSLLGVGAENYTTLL